MKKSYLKGRADKRWWVGLFLLVVLIAGGSFLYANIKKGSKSSKPSRTVNLEPTIEAKKSEADKKSFTEVVNMFYDKYDYCLKNPPPEAKGRVSQYCQENSKFITQDFVSNLEKGGTAKASADPIVCAQSFPESITVNQGIQIDGDKAAATVTEKFGPAQITPEIRLQKVGGVWKMDNIICPVPKNFPSPSSSPSAKPAKI